ncbi:MAG: Flp pilus assembly complex ATPase component TadA [Chloroflexi bacterium]|nr:Flp pilus assembly complex ATPase component TadA [Chloroflexota bacterium]
MAGQSSLSLARMLLDAQILSPREVEEAQRAARREGQSLGSFVVLDGLVSSRDLATLIALNLGLSMVDLRGQTLDPETVDLIPEEVARKYLVLPVKRTGNVLTVAMTDPADLQVLQDLSACSGYRINPIVATREDIQEHVDLSFRLTAKAVSAKGEQGPDSPGERLNARLLREAGPAQVINMLLAQALQDRASDVHIEPSETRLRIRFRIDGILHEVMDLPMDMHPAVISRLKIECGMNIAERRRPQDGQLDFQAQDRRVDVRVAISGTVNGEMAVLRILDNKGFTLLGLEQLGFGEEARERFQRLLQVPYGMVVVCGPTGSGKSTTLYASILQMNRSEKKVISIEDPVEYHIAEVNQMQVQADVGITFASQLRSILRLDPDVILIGEIRDQETAVIATQAALTGHLVLTSLHANDAVSAMLRLRELGVPAYLIASSVAGIVAQRMVRSVCSNCRAVEARPLAEQQAYASELGQQRQRFVYGSGCNMCAHTGYYGRTGVFEIMTMTDRIRQLFLEDAPRNVLLAQALDDGMTLLRRDGMLKVDQGITTPYEVMRVLFTLDSASENTGSGNSGTAPTGGGESEAGVAVISG